MAEKNPELQARLQELDFELNEGEITRKGYEKRRTLILSQYMSPAQAGQVQSSLRIHEPDDAPSYGTSRNASLGSITADPYGDVYSLQNGGRGHSNSPSHKRHVRLPSGDRLGVVNGGSAHNGRPMTPPTMDTPPSQVARFQEQQLGMRTPVYGQSSYGHADSGPRPGSAGSSYDSRVGTMTNSDYAFNPDSHSNLGLGQQQPAEHASQGDHSRLSTMLDSQQVYFSDFAGQQMQEQPRESYGGPHRYSMGEAFSPTAGIPPPLLGPNDLPPAFPVHQLPLEPRDVPFAVYDPHNSNVPMSKFDNIGAVLRHRGKTNPRQAAYWVLDQKGKETASITWEKLASRAEKVAQVIRDKSNLYRGDRVALVYRDTEVIDFAVAIMGCFIAGVVAVPINNVDDYQKLSLLLTTTQAHLALTTDNNLKAFHRDINTQRLKWPTGVEWWKTNEFGSYHPKRKDEAAALQVPDLAYIEFSRAPTGDLRGVVLSHRTIMHQMACISAIVSTIPPVEQTDTFNPHLRGNNGLYLAGQSKNGEIIMSYLDPREGAGLILGVLFGVYGGHTTVWLESKTVDTPGLYAHLITKYKTTIMVGDYPGLKRTAYNYQQDPMATRNFKKGMEPNFGNVKICLIDTITVDSEFHEILGDRWLRPMRNPRGRDLVAPMLCLPEHGGMIIAVRDWLGGEERMGCPLSLDDEASPTEDKKNDVANGYQSLIGGGGGARKEAVKKSRTELSEVLLDKEALKTNEVVVLAMGEEARKRANEAGTVRAGAFGYPIPDATLALVDPETNLLCSPFTVGEIWVDSPSLSGGFWALPKHTESIFHARPYRFVEGNPTPVLVEPEFLRTGLLGCIIEGKVYVLGLYEDRIRQRVEWVEHGVQELEHRYFFVQHLVVSIMKAVPKIYDCSAFDSHVNGEYLPIILIESQAASTAPTTTGGPPRQLDIPFLDMLSERVMEVLYQDHHLRVYCVMMTAPNTLPRVVKNGRRDIGNMLCRKEFDNGSLPCVHVKFGVERAVQNLPLGDDPAGGIWSPVASQVRQDLLIMQDKQYSGVDHREVVIDDRTSTPLNQFSNIHDLLQWRVSRQAEELSYCSVDQRGREGKGVNWKKFDLKVAAVAMYLKNKVKVHPNDHLLLMYTHSEDFVYAVHACICLGVVAVPMAPIDVNRLNEDAPALLHVIADFRIKAIIVNADVDQVLKQKAVSQHLKQSALILKVNLPNAYNTTKPTKQSHGCRELGLTIRPAWIQPGYPVIIWTYWTSDQRRIAVQLGHNTIMALCKVQKETCQMTSTRPVLGCVRSTMGLGFLHTCIMGIFLAAPTYLVSPVDFAGNPNILFQTLSRYKIKDTYATSQMLDHAIANGAGKGSSLHELKNLMIATDTRPRIDVYPKVRLHFAQAGLDRTAINTIYSHVLNPMIASRSYMCIEPIELFLDAAALRRGLVVTVDPDSEPTALLVQDSGMVPVSTQISIVNPETNRLCLVGEYGEIWVQSEATAHSFYGSRDAFDAERFNGRTVDGDPNVRYMRTGDLGFLHNVSRPIGPGGQLVEMQVLFVLGGIGETFEVCGLQHFAGDVEASVEKCHRNVMPGGCAVFQAGGLLVLIAEVRTRAFLASIVPVIVDVVLNEHQLVLDIVAFVQNGDFPRSRLGEKQRGKILASWVSRKMRTVAQFAVRDPEAEGSVGTVVPEDRDPIATAGGRRSSMQSGAAMGYHTGSLRKGTGTAGSSLRHSESVSALREPPLTVEKNSGSNVPLLSLRTSSSPNREDTYDATLSASLGGPFVMPAFDEPNDVEDNRRLSRNDDTPTNERPQPLQLNTTLDYSPVENPHGYFYSSPNTNAHSPAESYAAQERGDSLSYHAPPPPFSIPHERDPRQGEPSSQQQQQTYLAYNAQMANEPSFGALGGGGGLRVANRGSEGSVDWGESALRHMKLGR
ncbi:hypothetical protein LTR66_006495 [Elasticomyces elasticus]|nr:hypothetical protein LTR66_006495 [Elasticomyces elasticus]